LRANKAHLCLNMPFITRWHKTFHVLVFGSVVVLIIAVVALQRDFRQKYEVTEPAVTSEKAVLTAGNEFSENDSYGGTPEETIAGFIAALQRGDAANANLYFAPSVQHSWLEVLEQMENSGGLQNLAEELSGSVKNWTLEESGVDSATFVAGLHKISFVRNPLAGIWKISQL
jgi:hypothetical protein